MVIEDGAHADGDAVAAGDYAGGRAVLIKEADVQNLTCPVAVAVAGGGIEAAGVGIGRLVEGFLAFENEADVFVDDVFGLALGLNLAVQQENGAVG